MIRVAVVGLGKMGLSHHAMLNIHPDVDVVAVCDSSTYLLSILSKYSGVRTFSSHEQMMRECDIDAVVIATPSRTHAPLARYFLEAGKHVFCEKPLTLSAEDAQELTALAEDRGLVTQVGYHNKFVGAFREVKRLLDLEAIGTVTHALGEAYGPVVLKAKGGTWRSRREEGGGCLHDYAAHPIDLLTWYLGRPVGVGGTVLNSIFSKEIDDEVYGSLYFQDGRTAQIAANWSDESYRKMTTRITIWGTHGKIYADRQECQVYLRDTATVPEGYNTGWNVRYTTELTPPVWFYLRGEEYSAQLDHFVDRVAHKETEGLNTFGSAAATDEIIEMMLADSEQRHDAAAVAPVRLRRPGAVPQTPGRRLLGTARRLAALVSAAGPALTRLLGRNASKESTR